MPRTGPRHRWVVRLALLLVLAAAFAGWWWLMERTLGNEREAVVGRVAEERRQRFERALDTVGRGFERDRDELLARRAEDGPLAGIAGLLGEGRVTAVLFPEGPFEVREGVLPEAGGLDGLRWGSDGDGRDPVLGALLERLDEPGVRERVRPRLTGAEGPPMKASFRHHAIARFLDLHAGPDPVLAALARSEGIRAEGVVPADGLTFAQGADSLWWSRGQVIERFAAAGVEVVPGEEGRRFVPWDSPLRVAPAPVEEVAFPRSVVLVRAIGLGSGLLFALVVAGALASGWRDRRVARMRTDLAAAVAHELRTPLSGQRILLESLLDGRGPDEDTRRDYLERALRSNRRLGALTEQFLTFSRLERGILQIEREEVVVRELVEELIGDRPQPFDTVELEIPDGLVAHVDRGALTSIVGNLVANAWKYSEHGKWLKVSAGRGDGRFWLEVADQGRGLSTAECKKVFRQFWRADSGLDRKVDGLGLGLTVVARLAEAHGGDVVVRSEPGTGSTFRVTLKEEES